MFRNGLSAPAAAVVLLVTSTTGASQIVHMGLDDVVPMAGTILVVSIGMVEDCSTSGTAAARYGVTVIESLEGWAAPGACLSCTYSQMTPASYMDPDGCDVTEWPLVTGSGIEFSVAHGDTVVLLLRAGEIDGAEGQDVIRIEPLSSLEALIDLIVET